MKLNSTALGILILVIFFGGLSIATAQGWWQTQGVGGGQNRKPGGEGEVISIVTLHGTVSDFDSTRFELTTDDGQILTVEVGNARYNQSIGFAPQVDQGITVRGFFDTDGLLSAITVTLDTGQAYTFRDETGHPLWSGGSGQGNGGSH